MDIQNTYNSFTGINLLKRGRSKKGLRKKNMLHSNTGTKQKPKSLTSSSR